MDESQLATPVSAPKRKRLSLVWLMPVLAVVVAVAVVAKNYAEKGPLISVSFQAASGIEKGQTVVRFRDLQVGIVEDMSFAPGLTAIEAHIRLDKKIADYVDESAEFWLVEPRVSARGVSGLNTVLSGVYIQGNWDATPGEKVQHFVARKTPPLVTHGDNGSVVVLRSRGDTQLSNGAPVMFNGIEVGRLGEPKLSDTGSTVTVEAFIEAPHDQRLTTNTRFWDISGISLNVGAGGLSVDVESLAALVEGGISFGTMVAGGDAVLPGHVFDIYDTEEHARENVFDGDSAENLRLSVLLDNHQGGLTVGGNVRFQGAKVGEVTDLNGYVDPETRKVKLLVEFAVSPSKLGLGDDSALHMDGLKSRVANGLRARLASEGLLGQTVVLELVDFDDVAPAELVTNVTDLPLVPSGESNLKDASQTVDGLIGRINSLPIEELMNSAIGTLDGITAFVASPEAREIPANANGLLVDTREVIASGATRKAIQDLQTAASDVQALVGRIESSTGLDTFLGALERSDSIMTNIDAFSGKLPAIADDMEQITAQLAALQLQELVSDASAAVAALSDVVTDPSLKTVGPDAAASMASLQQILADLEQSGLVAELSAAATNADGLLLDLRSATADVPTLVNDASAVVASIKDLPIETVVQSLDRLLNRGEAVLSAPGIEDIPVALRNTLVELETSLTALREGGVVDSLNATLKSAQSTMEAIETATVQVPDVVARLNRVAGALEQTIAGYGPESRLNRDAQNAINEVARAAEAFRSLARTIERNPNSLITGR
ncbi:PqiB family protein [Pseudoprimorskyibacter insulae]|uniref:Paraquat-inducible protein B n=1 Tax=Pseudoprimorskyibacter insulae TaxID=1695997 RepID=A0A2R8B056_9RHOB|nr:MlaD family protein [Pseudoprimorskyibacter insulae]SPF81666.1 Paraquat-inducible protein B [Pseudoprimorskyibacter insulae]